MVDVTMLPRGLPLTRADLEAMPEDGHRYELIDGVLVVSPSPSWHHQRAVMRLSQMLHDSCPPELEVLSGPFDVALGDDTVMIPDVLVARVSDLTARDLPVAPVLAVEVLSPSTRRFDLMTKRSRYESAGTGSYWVVDPIEPSLTAWDLQGDVFVEVAHVNSDEVFSATLPFPVSVVPLRLVADR